MIDNISSRLRDFFKSLTSKTVVSGQSSKKISQVLDSSVHRVEKIIGDSSDLIHASTKWLTDMQNTLLVALVCLAIIVLCVLFFYCQCQGFFFLRRRSDNNRLQKITVVIPKTNPTTYDKY